MEHEKLPWTISRLCENKDVLVSYQSRETLHVTASVSTHLLLCVELLREEIFSANPFHHSCLNVLHPVKQLYTAMSNSNGLLR